MQYLLGIDIGTSGTKSVLFTTQGDVIASHTACYPMTQPRNGWAEQAPQDWWRAAVEGIRAVMRESGAKPDEVRGVGLSGQMHSLVMLDGDNRVLRPAILWCDGRTADECEEIHRVVGRERYFAITANPALTGFTAGKILWVRRHEPEIYEKCRHILLPKDYIRLMLTGEYATEVSDASGMGLLDVPRRAWSEEVLSRLQIDRSLLAPVYESPEITGTVTEAVARETGLAPGTPVVGGAGDNAAAAVGTGVVEDGNAFATIGTSGVVFAHTSKLSVDPGGRVHTFCCAVPGAWHVMGVTLAACQSLNWYVDHFCGTDVRDAEARGDDPYFLLDERAAESPIGSNRLLYLPYLMGERTPHLDPDCRGVFFGLSAMHTRYDLLRAVMEGVTFSLRDCAGILAEMGVSPKRILACGGGGASPFWRQMLADVLQIPVATTKNREGGALGVAILAGVGAGVYASVPEACRAIIDINAPQDPDATAHAAYQPYYEIYRALYPALKGQFAALAKL